MFETIILHVFDDCYLSHGNNIAHRIGQKVAFSERGKYYPGVKDFRKGSHHIKLILNNYLKSYVVTVLKLT